MKNLVLLERGVGVTVCSFTTCCYPSFRIPVDTMSHDTHKEDDWQQIRDLRCCFLCLAGHQPPCLWVLPAGFPQLPLCCLPVEILRKGLLHITLALISALECRLPSPHVQYGACKV